MNEEEIKYEYWIRHWCPKCNRCENHCTCKTQHTRTLRPITETDECFACEMEAKANESL